MEKFYFYDETAHTVYWTEDYEDAESLSYLEFLGSSVNPNVRMAVAGFTQKLPNKKGYRIKAM